MTSADIIDNGFTEHLGVIGHVRESFSKQILAIGLAMADALTRDGTIFWCGNGGSAADSQHLAAELVGRFKNNRRPLRSIALSTDTSVLTCVANDFGYEDIFARQVEALGRDGDVFVGISTSGKSENVIRALNAAKGMGIETVAFLGKDGGDCKAIADHSIVIPCKDTARIQEAHILIGHLLCEIVEKEMGFA